MEKTGFRLFLYLQSFFCSCILIFSCALITAATIIKTTFSEYSNFLYYYGTVLTTFIITGSLISLIIATWGYYAAYKKVIAHQISFIIVLSVNFIMHITLSLIYINYLEELLSKSIETLFDEQLSAYEENPEPLDFTQTMLKCCGKYQASDWFEYRLYIPASCCPEKPDNETIACELKDFFLVNHNGCVNPLKQLHQPSLRVITFLYIGLQISEIVTLVISSLSFYYMINNSQKGKSHKEKTDRIMQKTHL